MKSNLVFLLITAILCIGVCCNGNIKIKVNGRPVWGDGFVVDESNVFKVKDTTYAKNDVAPNSKAPGDTTKIGIVLDCSKCPDKTVSPVLDGVVWTGYKVTVKISATATANKYLMPDKTPIPRGCAIVGLVKLSE